jgi:hypothetical protein
MSTKQYKVHDDEVYEVVENKLYTTYNKCAVPAVKSVAPTWKGEPIPFEMWRDITDWCVLSYEKFKSETLVFLYYDLDNNKKPWSFWIVPQITNGMTVKSNPDSKFFAKERKNFPDTMFGTVHHHCSSSAFQSGTDHADELDREGLHFTIGNLDQAFDLDVHLRITIGTGHGVVKATSVIGADPKVQKCFESLQTSYNITKLKQAFDNLHESSICSASKDYKKRDKEFSKHYHKVEKPAVSSFQHRMLQSTSVGKPNIYSHAHGYATNSQMHFDDQTGWYAEKKTEEAEEEDNEVTYCSIAEEVLVGCMLTLKVDSLRQRYEKDCLQEINVLPMYHLDDVEVAETVLKMLYDEAYQETQDGLQFIELVEDYIEENWNMYDITTKDLAEGIETWLMIETEEDLQHPVNLN